jgi:glutaconyl-CoA/methylmalonyl-CoA decarboxylase subunit gamma
MKSYKITVNGRSYDVSVEEVGGGDAPAAPVAQAAPRAPSPASPPAPRAAQAGSIQVRSPMPGTLLSFKVAQGKAVKQGEVVLILEAMKMENEIVAPADGVVTALSVSEGASVNTGDVLLELA